MTSTETHELSVVQITDLHLSSSPDATLAGMKCEASLNDVVEQLIQEQSHVDLVLCTGDITQDGSREAYQRASAFLARLNAPVLYLPGNHDNVACMQEVLGYGLQSSKVTTLGNWRFIMLNSALDGAVHGYIHQDELEFLAHELTQARQQNLFAMVCLHHNCIPVQARWLQKNALHNPEQLFAVLESFENVRLVCFGHIHQEISAEHHGAWVFGTPSTCVQFHPEHDNFHLDNKGPGYRQFILQDNGEFTTEVHRVKNKDYHIDLDSTGY